MTENKLSRPMIIILIIYLFCCIFRGLEYFLIRTDESFFGEAFIHKLIGILILGLALIFSI